MSEILSLSWQSFKLVVFKKILAKYFISSITLWLTLDLFIKYRAWGVSLNTKINSQFDLIKFCDIFILSFGRTDTRIDSKINSKIDSKLTKQAPVS